MSPEISLKEAERRAFRLSTSQDGLYDTFLGLFFVLMSAVAWLDENGLRTPWNVILVEGIALLILLGVLAVKKFIVAPRVGRVRYGPERKARLKRLSIAMGLIFLLTVALLITTVLAIRRGPLLDSPPDWGLELDPVDTAAGIFILAIFSLIGYMNDYPRLYLYGALLGLGYITSTYLQDQTGMAFYWPWAFVGALVVVIGLITFVRFLRKFPELAEPVLNDIG